MLGWILFLLSLIWYFGSRAYSRRKRNKLAYYLVYLLVDDNIWENHHRTLLEWVDRIEARGAMELFTKASVLVEHMAESVDAAGETLEASAMLWNERQARSAATRR